MLALNIYRALYETKSSRGPGQAKAVVFFILVAVISIVQLSSTRKKEVQQ
jgi:raffinose/stachyose/melibiose transport system permease protein